MIEFKQKVEQRPVTVTVCEQIEAALANYSGAAVILVPEGDQNMKMFYRSGTGGAWWKVDFNEEHDKSWRLLELLRDVEHAVLVAREDVDALLSGERVFINPMDA